MTDPIGVPAAIAAIDEQISTEDARMKRCRADLDDAQTKLDALRNAREPLIKLAELYTGIVSPPPRPPDFSQHIPAGVTAGPGVGDPTSKPPPPKPKARKRASAPLTDALVLDAIRALGGQGTKAEIARILECSVSASNERVNRLINQAALDVVHHNGHFSDQFSIPVAEPGSPDTRPDDCSAPGFSHTRPRTRAGDGPALAAATVPDPEPEPLKPEPPDPDPDPAPPDPDPQPEPESPEPTKISAPTRRAMATQPRREHEPTSIPDRLLEIMRSGAIDSRWKINDLRQNYGRRWPGHVPSSEDVGRGMGTLIANRCVYAEGVWFALRAEVVV